MSPRDTPAGPHGYPVADSPALGPVPRDYLTPEPLACLDCPPCPTPRALRRAGAWFAELSEHLPQSVILGRFNLLDSLRADDGASPAEAAAVLRAYHRAPHLVPPQAGPRMAPPVH